MTRAGEAYSKPAEALSARQPANVQLHYYLGELYLQGEETEKALEAFRVLLERPSLTSARFLAGDPRLGEVREDPGLQALLKEFE